MKKKLILALALSLSLFAVACGEKKAASGGESSVNSETSVSGENAESKAESASGAADAKEETAAEGEPTAARYLALKQGMSYEEVKKIFGAEGKAGAAKGSYTWSDADGMKLVTVAFDNDKLIAVSQIGVIENKDAKVTLEAYNKLNPELSYAEVKEILGSEGVPVSTSFIAGQTIANYSWSNADGSGCALTFANDKLSSMTSTGLQ
ncbi:DUF3862 domain-containing protein [Stomatobaculum longum]|uniref:DUF3862 domain-containing protein n=1 Tax=Stomatobaculum longum TaxID=796942 RepID=UPI0028DB1797|nr:DUF3862 domain-containing protein [Stomatobaculum longum]